MESKIKRILVTSPMSYGPPWREGVSNLARRLVDFLIQRQLEVNVLSPATTQGGPKVLDLGVSEDWWLFHEFRPFRLIVDFS